jgi:hypothetical protein
MLGMREPARSHTNTHTRRRARRNRKPRRGTPGFWNGRSTRSKISSHLHVPPVRCSERNNIRSPFVIGSSVGIFRVRQHGHTPTFLRPNLRARGRRRLATMGRLSRPGRLGGKRRAAPIPATTPRRSRQRESEQDPQPTDDDANRRNNVLSRRREFGKLIRVHGR